MNLRRSTAAIALASALAMPTLAHASPDPRRSVRVEVDVSALPQEDRYTEDTRQWVRKTQTAAFEGVGFTVTESATDVVRIEISRYGDYGIHTRATLMLVGDADSAREFTCEACKDSDFIAKVDEETKRFAERLLQESEAEPVPASEPTAAVAEGPTAPEHAAADGHAAPEASEALAVRRPARLGGVGVAGIASLAGGLGFTVGGVVVLLEEPSRRPHPGTDNDTEITDRIPLGVGLTGVGAGLLVAGAALLVVDQTVLRTRRGHARASAFIPTVGSAGAGLWWATRF